jgi:Ca2+-binding RTX toxin-like protein
MRRLATPVGLAILMLAVGAPVAAAGMVGTGPGDAVGFTAGASEVNRVTVTMSGSNLVVSDPGAAMGASGGCTMLDPQTAECPATPQTRLTLRGGDLDDEITNASGIGAEMLGGDGHDVLRGSTAPDRLDGEAGPDGLDGGPGDDALGAGPGPPAADADSVVGGPGTDSVSYAARSAGVVVTEDGVANDGATGEGDNVALDVEQITGSSAADRLLGGPGPNLLDGGPGDDAIDGGSGDDDLIGDGGVAAATDTMAGGPGNDRVRGEGGNDGVDGGPGDDAVEGGTGADMLSGGAGADQILGGPDADVVSYASSVDVTVHLDDGTARSDELGDVDNVLDVESAIGGRRADTITGTDGGNVLVGAAGEDYVEGARGPDRLDGGESPDVVDARDGGRDGAVSCGPGIDFAITDRGDPVTRRGPNRCERVDDGSDRRPRAGWVVVRPARCEGAELGLPAMRRLVPLRDSILLATGFRGRGSPRLAATDCAVRVTATPGRGRAVAADVTGAPVTVRQSGARRVTTTLRVARPRCGSGAARLSAQARGRRVRLRTQRRAGRWRVQGRHSIAASFGTDWTTLEGCSRTVTIVRRGRVRVFDRAKRRTVVVRAGQRYVARRR